MRPSAVTRRILAPLAWLVVLVPPAVVWTVTDYAATSAPLVADEDALRLDADIDASYDGDLEVPMRYRNPVTDQTVEVSVPVYDQDLRPAAGARVEVLVHRDDPDAVMVPGDREPLSWRLAEYVWLPLIPLAVTAARWFFARRVRRVIEHEGPSFSMLASVSESRVSPQRLIHLHPLDAPAGARPLCTVAVLPWTEGVPRRATYPVEVKGSPRPFGLVVVRVGERVLWSTGVARSAAKVARPPQLGTSADLAGGHRDHEPPAAAVLDPAWLGLGLLLSTGLAIFVAIATLTGHNSWASRVATGDPVVVEAIAVLEYDYTLQVRYTDPDGTEREAIAVPEWPEDYTLGRRYPARLVGGEGNQVELSAERYDRVEPILWGALIPAIAAALTIRHRIYTGPWKVPTGGSSRHLPGQAQTRPSPHRYRPRHRRNGGTAIGPTSLRDPASAGWVAVVAALAATGLWVGASDARTKTDNMLERGVRTDGVVTVVTTGRSAYVQAEYRTEDGRTLRRSTINYAGNYDVGDPIAVIYDPAHPDRMEAADWGTDYTTPYALGAIASLATLTALVYGTASVVHQARRHRRQA